MTFVKLMFTWGILQLCNTASASQEPPQEETSVEEEAVRRYQATFLAGWKAVRNRSSSKKETQDKPLHIRQHSAPHSNSWQLRREAFESEQENILPEDEEAESAERTEADPKRLQRLQTLNEEW